MATILIVEDRPIARQPLTGLLQTAGHEIVEAADGPDALDILAEIKPDLVITDVLMPTVDAPEFVRRMRAIPPLLATPVLFYTAAYHEPEARALARRCGAADILTKPSAPQVILSTVQAALGSSIPVPSARPDRTETGREHPHAAKTAVAAGSDRIEAERQRISAVLEVAEQIAAERDPIALLNRVCMEARRVTLAQHAVVGLLTEEGSSKDMLIVSGLDDATAAAMRSPSVDGAFFTAVVRERRRVRTRNRDGRPEALGLPADHPMVCSLLSVPIASSRQVYGWLSLRNKLGADEFSEVDERVAVALGAHAGIAYENLRLLDDLHRRVGSDLDRTSARVREAERAGLSRTPYDQMGQVLAGLKIDVHWLAAQLNPGAGNPRHDITARVDSILQRLDETIGSLRTIAGELRPTVLDRLGLVAAIEWQAEDFERRSGIRCRVDARIDQTEFDPGQAATIFAIVQEALTNVFRHAHATRATVMMQRSANSMTLSIADNGRGIPDRDLADGGSLGMIGMRERSALLGGTLDVRRRRPRGTVVAVTVPLADRQQRRRKRS